MRLPGTSVTGGVVPHPYKSATCASPPGRVRLALRRGTRRPRAGNPTAESFLCNNRPQAPPHSTGTPQPFRGPGAPRALALSADTQAKATLRPVRPEAHAW